MSSTNAGFVFTPQHFTTSGPTVHVPVTSAPVVTHNPPPSTVADSLSSLTSRMTSLEARVTAIETKETQQHGAATH